MGIIFSLVGYFIVIILYYYNKFKKGMIIV